MKIISLWSGPRNVSTALMYSFAQRKDMRVVDEPLYAHYLCSTDAEHIGGQEVIDDMVNDGDLVMRNMIGEQSEKMTFIKNMAHHWEGLKDDYLLSLKNIFLVRDPQEMLPSLSQQITNPVLRDTGLKKQVDIYKYLKHQNIEPVIILSKDLLLDPAGMLSAVCKQLGIEFDPAMLSWQKGPRPEDGIWAKYWYHNVHKSTGFATYKKKEEPFPEYLEPLLEECIPYYKFLSDNALKP